MNKLINKIITWFVIILTGLIPLFFLPFTSDFYDFNKNILLFFSVLLLLILWSIKIIVTKEVKLRRMVFDLPILAIAVAFILSTIFSAPNKLETLWLPNGTGTIIALTLLYFIISNNLKKSDQSKALNSFVFSSFLLSLISIYQFIGLGETFIDDSNFFAFLKSKSWTPAGGLIPLTTFLTVSLVFALGRIYAKWKANREILSLPFYLLTSLSLIAGIVISLLQIFSYGVKPLFLPFSTGWAIVVESFKNGKIFLLGVGPKSFLDAFSRFRPLNYNLTSLWSIRFGDSSNFYLHLLSTVGILGLAAWIWLVLKTIKKRPLSFLHYPIFAIFLIFLFLPNNFLLLFALYLLIALAANNLPGKKYEEKSRILPWAIFIPTILIVIGALYLTGRTYAADVYFKRSLNNISQNEGTKAYNNQAKAISLNPYNDVYRISYSQTNLLLADALASNQNISDQDRQSLTTLIQQSISEAKIAVSLNKNKITNWENLANIYRQLINFAQGADQWTITTLRQAINLEPTNPELKLNLGGAYYALGNYDEAVHWFQQAIDDKPNFANGYYNLSAAYKEKGYFEKAHEMMQVTLNLIHTSSTDYQKARDELEELAKKLPAEETTPSAETQTTTETKTENLLNKPKALPSPVIEPSIGLPEEELAPEINLAPEATP